MSPDNADPEFEKLKSPDCSENQFSFWKSRLGGAIEPALIQKCVRVTP
jgi:hypothetical protein